MRLLPSLSFLLGISLTGPALAIDYPKPEPARQFPELKIYDAAGRPWRQAREDWEGARRRVAGDPAWTAWFKKERATVDAWMAKHRDRVEWEAGWSHDGVSPKDGSTVTWTEAIPGEEAAYFFSPSDSIIPLTPSLKRWWVVTFRGKHVDILRRAALLHRLTGDRRYADWAAGQIDFYADNLLLWKPQRQEARLFGQSLTEASNLVKFAETVRVLGDFVPSERRERWKTQFFAPEVAVLNKSFQSIHNIAVWQRAAAAQVALVYGDEARWKEALDGPFGLRRQLAEGITSDYLWHEQSLGYNNFVVQALLGLFTAAGLQDRADELTAELNVAENLMLSPVYLRFPNGRLPNPADSVGLPVAPNLKIFAEASRVFPTPIGIKEAAAQRDWVTLLDPPAASPRPAALPAVTSRNLESSRMALLKSGPWQVFFHYGQLTLSHAQAEALNYSVFYEGTDLSHDSGVVGYGSPLYRNYYTQALNHNVPLVNNEGQVPPQPGRLLEFSTDPARVSASQPTYRPGVSARRTLAIEAGALVDTVVLESELSAAFGLALQIQGKVRLPAAFEPHPTFATDWGPAAHQWKNARSARYQDRAEFEVDYGTIVMRVTLSIPGEFTVWHGSTPDAPPGRRESLYLETPPARNATFTTTFTPVERRP